MARESAIGREGSGYVPTGSGGPAWSLRDGLWSALVVGVLIWCYWPVVLGLLREWWRDENYSAGALVLPIALFVAWQRRAALRRVRVSISPWAIIALLFAVVMRFLGMLFVFESAERYSFVLMIGALIWLLVGDQMARKLIWVLTFLALMVPLPGKVHNAIANPLREWATSATVFTLEVMGQYIERQGNVLIIDGEHTVGIEEACSGLRMLTAFMVVGAAFALLADRPLWQKAILVASSVPIALASNLVRLVVTSFLFTYTESAFAERFFHDFAGLTMMPVAVVLMLLELMFLAKLVERDTPADRTANESL